MRTHTHTHIHPHTHTTPKVRRKVSTKHNIKHRNDQYSEKTLGIIFILHVVIYIYDIFTKDYLHHCFVAFIQTVNLRRYVVNLKP